jgi:hypothetical protein
MPWQMVFRSGLVPSCRWGFGGDVQALKIQAPRTCENFFYIIILHANASIALVVSTHKGSYARKQLDASVHVAKL